MVQDLAALAYLDLRSALNALRSIIREPKRMLAWSLYVILFANAWLQRSIQRRFTTPGFVDHTWLSTLAPAIVDLASPALLCLLGYSIVAAAIRNRPRFGFTWPADGRFLCGSRLSPRTVVLWLQLRSAWALLVRWPLVLLILVGMPGLAQERLSAVFVAGFAVAAAFLLNWQCGNASALLSRFARAPLIAFGALLLLGGVGTFVPPLAAAAADPSHAVAAIEAHAVLLAPGDLLSRGLSGDVAAVFWLIALAGVFAGAAIWAAGDCYPEMWQASTRLFVLRQMVARGSIWQSGADASLRRQLESAELVHSSRAKAIAASASDARFGGAWTIVWKDWISFRRGPLAGWGPVGRVVLIVLVAGSAGVVLSSSASDPGAAQVTVYGLAFAGLITYVQVLALASAGIASELRMPFWSLSVARLPVRLLAWACASSWRPALGCAVAVAALAIAGHHPIVAFAALPAAALVTVATRIVGIAAFTILPHHGDARGPAAMLRLLLVYLLMVPAGVVGALVGWFGGVGAGISAAVVVVTAECAALLLFAGTRLEGNAMSFAGPRPIEA